jgi:radical SAM superfamily enzyme YgiQ (UPF0313 family)
MMNTTYPKTLIINPPLFNPLDRRRSEALGIAYIASYLREKGYGIELLDANQKETIDKNKIINFVLDGVFDIVGISVIGLNVYNTMEIARRIKEKKSEITIVAGGHHATAAHQEILKDFPFMDIVVRGEGERTFFELVKALKEKKPLEKILGISYRENGEIKVNPQRPLIKNLDEIPFPARDLLPSEEQYGLDEGDYVGRKKEIPIDIVTSRGCAFHCSFCSIPAFYSGYNKGKVRSRSAENIVDEIEGIIKKKKRGYIGISDDNFFQDIKGVLAIIKELKRRHIELPILCTTRADQIIKNERYIPYLRKNGVLWIELGVESGNDSVLKRYKKGTTAQENKQALQILGDNDIGIIIDFIMFDPQTTIEELEKNVLFLEEYDGFCHDPKKIYNRLDLFVGTSYGEWMRNKGRWKDIHNPVSYEFEDKNVDRVFIFLMEFARDYQRRLDNLTEEIMDLWAPVAHQINSGIKEKRELEAELCFKHLELRRVPRSVLKLLLLEGKKIGFDSIVIDEIFKPFVDKICEAESFVKDIREKLGKQSINKKDLSCTT